MLRVRGIEKASTGEKIKALVIVGGSGTKRVNVTSEGCQTRVSTKDRRRRDLLPGSQMDYVCEVNKSSRADETKIQGER